MPTPQQRRAQEQKRAQAAKPQAVPRAEDVSAANTEQGLPDRPDTGVTQVPGGFAKMGEDDNKNDVTYLQPDVEIKGLPPAESSQEPLSNLLDPAFIKTLIDAGVRAALSDMEAEKQQRFVEAEQRTLQNVPQFNYLKHFRNDVSPEIMILELDMSSDNPQMNPLSGQYIQFRRGHFFATTENQVKQLEWMMSTAEHTADTTGTLGGNRAIYVDDEEKLFYCTAGCPASEFVSASEAKYKAHMRGVHGINL